MDCSQSRRRSGRLGWTWSRSAQLPEDRVDQPSATGAGATSQTWQIGAKGSFSLAFNQPGTYDYYRLEEPTQRARIIVSG